jgi:hypothetical protein
MSHCTQIRKGNLYDSPLPSAGPYNAAIEKVCQDDESFTRQYSSFTTNQRPDNPQAITQSLEKVTNKPPSQPGLFGNMANMLRSVLGSPNTNDVKNANRELVSKPQSNQNQNQNQNQNMNATTENMQYSNIPQIDNNNYILHDQNWPSPQLEEDNLQTNVNTNALTGGVKRQIKKKKTKSLKKRRSVQRKYSYRKKSNHRKSASRKR